MSRKTFGCWLAAIRSDDPIGDLAHDFRRDCYVSGMKHSQFKTPKDLADRMVSAGASREAKMALATAGARYWCEVRCS